MKPPASPPQTPPAGARNGMSSAMLDQATARAQQLHERGQLQEAADGYARVLRADPGHAEANHLYGLLLNQTGRRAEAIAPLRRAIDRDPANFTYRSNLGVVLKELGRLDKAVASYRAALDLDATVPQIWSNLGVALLGLNEIEQAIDAQNRALALSPDFAEAHANLGLAQVEAGKTEAAITSYRRAIELRPAYAAAHNHLAVALRGVGALEEAASEANRAIELQPMLAAAHHTLGNVLRDQRRYDDAVLSYRRALQLKPEPVAYRNLAGTLNLMMEHRDAAAAARAGLDLDAEDAILHAELGVAMAGRQKHPEALDAMTEALRFDPDSLWMRAAYARALGGGGFIREALEQYRLVKAAGPDEWKGGGGSYLFALNYAGEVPIGEMVEDAKAYGRSIAAEVTARTSHPNTPDPARRLKVGFVSGDFRYHPVGRFMLSVLENFDHTGIELFAYNAVPEDDALTPRFKKIFPNWRDVARLSDDDLAELIVGDGIDVLVDASGHSSFGRMRMFASKPAPVSVTWLGYFATTGIAAIDYVLATRWVIPPDEEDQWVERPWRMPDTYLCFGRPEVELPLVAPPVTRNGYITFGSANHINKLSDRAARCWAGVLAAVPNSRLVLRAGSLADPRVAEATRQRFANLGIAPDRIITERAVDGYALHLGRYNEIDIALDPFPYAGGTTTVEALWMGVPVLTLKGDRYVAHMGENIHHNVGTTDWIAADTDDYVRKAAAFAADVEGLTALRHRLRDMIGNSPLMNSPRFARQLNEAFRGMWQVWCEQQNTPV